MRNVLARLVELACRPLDTKVYALAPVTADDDDRARHQGYYIGR